MLIILFYYVIFIIAIYRIVYLIGGKQMDFIQGFIDLIKTLVEKMQEFIRGIRG